MNKIEKYNYQIILNDINKLEYYINTSNWEGYSEGLQAWKDKLKVYKKYKSYCEENKVCPFIFYSDILELVKSI